MNRRTLLKWMTFQAATFPWLLQAQASITRKRRHLILIELQGGNDGLNTVVPYRDPLYYRFRPTIALPRRKVLPLDDTLALHPSMKALKNIYDRKELAIVQGLGYPDPNRSHFRSIEIWDTASGPHHYLDSGWLQSLQPPYRDAINGVVLGGEYGPLSGAEHGIVKIHNLHGFLSRSRRIHAQIYMTGGNRALQHILATEAEIRQSANILSRYFRKNEAPPYPYPPGDFGRQLHIVTTLIREEVPIPFFKLHLGSFDTHINQLPKQARLLKILSEGLGTLRKNLLHDDHWDNTLVMTYSEFGRRVAENASHGTDHGTAAPHFLIGGRVMGGLYGQTPSLKTLDKNGDLIHTTDFRSYYHTIASQWLMRSSTRIEGFPAMNVLR